MGVTVCGVVKSGKKTLYFPKNEAEIVVYTCKSIYKPTMTEKSDIKALEAPYRRIWEKEVPAYLTDDNQIRHGSAIYFNRESRIFFHDGSFGRLIGWAVKEKGKWLIKREFSDMDEEGRKITYRVNEYGKADRFTDLGDGKTLVLRVTDEGVVSYLKEGTAWYKVNS